MFSKDLKKVAIILITIFVLLSIFILFIAEGIYYIGTENVDNFKIKENKISISDTLRFHNIQTYLNCKFEKLNTYFKNDELTIYGKMPLDKNHIFPGIGKINVVAWVDVDELNLNNSILQLDIQTNDSNLNLHFWFQTERENRRISNFMTVEPIKKYSTFHNGFLTIKLPINQVKFKCMGTSLRKVHVYGCDISLKEALSNVNMNFGLINLLNYSFNDSCTDINLKLRNLYLIR